MTSAVAAEPVPIEKSAGEVWLITGTRVPLETVVAAFTDGATPEEIVCQYPALSLPDVAGLPCRKTETGGNRARGKRGPVLA